MLVVFKQIGFSKHVGLEFWRYVRVLRFWSCTDSSGRPRGHSILVWSKFELMAPGYDKKLKQLTTKTGHWKVTGQILGNF